MPGNMKMKAAANATQAGEIPCRKSVTQNRSATIRTMAVNRRRQSPASLDNFTRREIIGDRRLKCDPDQNTREHRLE